MIRQRVPRSRHRPGSASNSSMVSAGAPEKPSAASSAAEAPAKPPMVEPSFSIDGCAMTRIIMLRGP